LKKRTKKLLRGCRGLVGDSRVKVFASFFKKKRFLFVSPDAGKTIGAPPLASHTVMHEK
jgi:hypothetical protein